MEAFYKLQLLSGCQKKKKTNKQRERFFCSTVISTSNRRLPVHPYSSGCRNKSEEPPTMLPAPWGRWARHVRVLLLSYSPHLKVLLKLKFLSSPLKEKEDVPGDSECKESACTAGDLGSLPELGRSPGEGHSNPLQYSCLGNPMDRGACWAQSMGSQRSRQKEKISSYSHMGLYKDKSTQRPCVNSSSPKDDCPSGSAGPKGSNHWAQKMTGVHAPRWLRITTRDKQCPKRLFVICHILFCGSVTKLCPTPHDLMDCSLPGSSALFTISQSFLRFKSRESVMLSNPLTLCRALLSPLIFPHTPWAPKWLNCKQPIFLKTQLGAQENF